MRITVGLLLTMISLNTFGMEKKEQLYTKYHGLESGYIAPLVASNILFKEKKSNIKKQPKDNRANIKDNKK